MFGSQNLFDAVMKILAIYKLNIKDCRGQSYEDSANMSGHYSRLQVRIKQEFPTAEFVPCWGHTLNLVGQTAANCYKKSADIWSFL